MSLAAPLLLHYNVDCLAPCGSSGQLVAGLSNFIGPCWTGGIALLSAAGEGPAQLQTLVELRAGVPALACLHRVDEFTGAQPPLPPLNLLWSDSPSPHCCLYTCRPPRAGHRQ